MAKQGATVRKEPREAKPARATGNTGRKAAARKAPRKRKQAVVIVHGMGEQRPLDTLRSFAEAVWGGSTVPDETRPSSHHDLWIVPDTRAGLKELARIRTRNVRQDGDVVGTDFYELYWADKLTGNTLTQLRTWVFTLLLRWPHQVPRETAGMWAGLWIATAVIVWIIAYAGMLPGFQALKQLFVSAPEAAVASSEPSTIANILARAGLPLYGSDGSPAIWVRVVGGASVALAGWLFAVSRLSSSLAKWSGAERRFKGTWQSATAAQSSLNPVWDWVVALVVPLVAGLSAAHLFPWSTFPWGKGLLFLSALMLTYVISAFVVPYLGDVARYVRAAPDAVSARADIRERGLALMRTLHGVGDEITHLRYDFGDKTRYDRIIVVGHSLGSIIAYDVLRLLWEEIGPTAKNPPDGAVLARLKQIDGYCKERYGKPQDVDPVEYRRLQGELIEQYRSTAPGAWDGHWLVSDFVSVGSPLTHAEFLVSPDRLSFEERKAERQFPTSPPMLEHGRQSFMYETEKRLTGLHIAMPDAKTQTEVVEQTHHAAMFAATRWVNIYDPAKGLLGDLVSGPCRPNFGPGIVDIPVKISRTGMFGRVFTHTDYWNLDAKSELLDASWQALEDEDHRLESSPPRHIALLRLATRLRRRIPNEPPVADEG